MHYHWGSCDVRLYENGKKKKRTLRSHTDRSRVLKLGAEMNAYSCHFSKHILVKQHTEAFQQVAGNKFLYGIIMGFYINPMMDLYVDSGWRFFVFWSSGSTARSPVCFMLQAPYDPERCAYILKWSPYLVSADCWRCAVLRMYRGRQFFMVWFCYSSLAKAG